MIVRRKGKSRLKVLSVLDWMEKFRRKQDILDWFREEELARGKGEEKWSRCKDGAGSTPFVRPVGEALILYSWL